MADEPPMKVLRIILHNGNSVDVMTTHDAGYHMSELRRTGSICTPDVGIPFESVQMLMIIPGSNGTSIQADMATVGSA